jgi:hypothetical protein
VVASIAPKVSASDSMGAIKEKAAIGFVPLPQERRAPF